MFVSWINGWANKRVCVSLFLWDWLFLMSRGLCLLAAYKPTDREGCIFLLLIFRIPGKDASQPTWDHMSTGSGSTWQAIPLQAVWWLVGWAFPQKKRRPLLVKEGKAGQNQLWWPPYHCWLALGQSRASLFRHLCLCFVTCEMKEWAELTSEIIQPNVLFPFVLVLFPPAKFCSSATGVKWKKTWLWAASVKEVLMEVSFTLRGQAGEGGMAFQGEGLGRAVFRDCYWVICLPEFFFFFFFFLRVNIFVRDTMLTHLYFLLN